MTRDASGSFDAGEAMARASGALSAGDVVAIPTDTVYGLAADPTRAGATGALFALKGRPAELDLPVLVASVEQAEALAGPDGLPAPARWLADAFWPGALTVVVPRRAGLEWDLGSAGDTVGLRLPDHPIARALCERVGPLAATSANRHGEPPCTDAASVTAVFGAHLVVVDGGRCAGRPSTVVTVIGSTARCLREGAVSWVDVERVLAGR